MAYGPPRESFHRAISQYCIYNTGFFSKNNVINLANDRPEKSVAPDRLVFTPDLPLNMWKCTELTNRIIL